MEKLEKDKIKTRIFEEMRSLQCYEPDQEIEREKWEYNDDETPLMSYKKLSLNLGLDKKVLRPLMIELRNGHYIELVDAYDSDYMISGSGYVLTEKGVEYINSPDFLIGLAIVN